MTLRSWQILYGFVLQKKILSVTPVTQILKLHYSKFIKG